MNVHFATVAHAGEGAAVAPLAAQHEVEGLHIRTHLLRTAHFTQVGQRLGAVRAGPGDQRPGDPGGLGFCPLRHDYRRDLPEWSGERAEKAEKLNAISQLKSETIKQATEKGISLEFINTINFEFETAETIKSKLEILEKAVKKEREIAINEYSKEDAPQTGERVQTVDIKNMGYEELAEYFNKHPEAKI